MPKVFISYRRSDTTPGYASWIYDRLAETFGADSVFMDIDSLPLGVDFVEQLERSLHQTDVALILIGPNWLAASDESGARRLDDPDDFVRLEVAAALRAETRVIPVLVDGARMPAGHELPEELGFLARRQALVFVRHGGGAIRDLVNAIRDADSARARPAEHAPPSEQAPAQGSERGVPPQGGPAAPAPKSRGARRRAIPLAVGAGVELRRSVAAASQPSRHCAEP